MEIKRSGSQPSGKGSPDYFTGTVRIDPLFSAPAPARAVGASVTFEPGARTAWHTHPLGQTLIVTSGCGRAQRWGGPIEEIRPGDVVWFAPGEKHWHGAAPATAMTHIAIQEQQDGKVVDWLEQVTDEQYRSGRHALGRQSRSLHDSGIRREYRVPILERLAVLLILSMALAACCRAQTSGKSASISQGAMGLPISAGSLPDGFASVLLEIKAKSHAPVLLPSKLPAPVAKAAHALVQKVTANEYEISLYYELGIGDAGFAASFAADTSPHYHPQDLGNVRAVRLSRGIPGFFRPVNCGGSCAPANLWWEEGGILYKIQLKLPPPSLSESDQQKAIISTADSSILAGPR